MARKIRFIARAVRWHDRINGNTYHSVRVTRCRDGAELRVPMQYGYGDHYRQSALAAMAAARWLPVAYRAEDSMYRYEMDNGYPIEWAVLDGLKRECQANGIAA